MEPSRSTYGEITSLVFAIGTFISMFVIIFITTYVVLFTKKANLNDEEAKKEIGSFYEDMKVDSTWALLYTPIYILRRLIFCILILTIPEYPLI